MSTDSVTHKFLTGLSIASVLTGLIMSIVFTARALDWTCEDGDCQSMLFITTTFQSSRRIEATMGWPVATERALSDAVFYPFSQANAANDRSYRFGHFLECMHTARMVDTRCSPDLEFPAYAACLSNTTGVLAGLDQCASFPTVGSYYHWPTPEEYLGCLWNNPLLRNSESQRASQNVFRSCVERSMWPFFEVPLGIDTPVFMGSYNWALLLVAGFVLMTSFGVYQVSWKEEGMVMHGETGWGMRLGLFWAGVALLWNIAFLGVFLAVAFRGSGEFQTHGGLPTTSSTTFVTFLVMGAGVLYFLSIVFHPTRTGRYMTWTYGDAGLAKVVPMPAGKALADQESRGRLLGATFPKNKGSAQLEEYVLSAEEVTKYYTPPLLATWADSYFADFCIVMGMAGATGQLSTDRAWNLFTLTFIYRILNMIISRCISDAFMNNLRLDENLNKGKRDIIPGNGIFHKFGQVARKGGGVSDSVIAPYHLTVQVVGLSTQLAAFYLYLGLLVLVFDTNFALHEFGVFQAFFVLCFLIPELLRLLLHLVLQLFYDVEGNANSVPWLLYNSAFFIWIWDYVFRLIFIGIVLLGTSDNPGTLEFLKEQTSTTMGTFVTAMAA